MKHIFPPDYLLALIALAFSAMVIFQWLGMRPDAMRPSSPKAGHG